MEGANLKKYKRCCLDGCKDKLRLFSHRCGCQKEFCLAHKAPEDHECTYKKEQNMEEFVNKLECVAPKMIKV
jgi:hypothetical protein